MARILIVDDDDSIRILMKEMLQDAEHSIFEATNGSEAKQTLMKEKIDLIVTDLVMPEKSGIDLILELKDSHSSVPIVAVSGGGGITGRFDYLPIAKLIGADRVLNKPFSASVFREVVDTALN